MRRFFKATIAAAALGGASLAAVQPAEAHDGGAAIVAGIIGLGVGAAIASSSNHHAYYERSGYQPAYGGGYYDGYAPTYGVTYDRGWDHRGGYDRGYDRSGWDRNYGDRGWRR